MWLRRLKQQYSIKFKPSTHPNPLTFNKYAISAQHYNSNCPHIFTSLLKIGKHMKDIHFHFIFIFSYLQWQKWIDMKKFIQAWECKHHLWWKNCEDKGIKAFWDVFHFIAKDMKKFNLFYQNWNCYWIFL